LEHNSKLPFLITRHPEDAFKHWITLRKTKWCHKTEEKNFNAFKTRKGRTVYDGGGIQPDIELEDAKSSPSLML
jgi:hypothetical protein